MPIRLGGTGGEAARVGFRGDDRQPTAIFASGFSARDMTVDVRYRPYREEITGMMRPQLYDAMPGDVDPDSGVTFSARFLAAAMFPLRADSSDPQVSDTYVYGVVADTGLFNAHHKQALQGLQGLRNWNTMMGQAVDEQAASCAFWPLYAQEMAAKRIPNTHIVGALRVRRTWRGNDYKSGATFTFHGPVAGNINCAVDKRTRHLVMDVLTEYANDGTGVSPEKESGYGASTRR